MRHKEIGSFVKNESKREKLMKYVRVDSKTVIIVDSSIPDDEAKNNFLLKFEDNRRKFEQHIGRSRNEITKRLWEQSF